jgi:phosphate ABC transporter permease protein PstC
MVAWAFSLAAVAAFVALAGFLVVESWPFLSARAPGFLVDPVWAASHERYGALSMIFGTCGVAAIALALAGPLGILGAIHLSELLPLAARPTCKVVVDLLAGVPSVVYGLIGIELVRGPVEACGLASGDSLLTAGLVLGVMILPTVLSLSFEALRAVGRPYREACRALGLSDAETIIHGVLRPALPGLVAAIFLALGRALGETVAVFLLVGRADGRFPASLGSVFASLRTPGQTLTSKLGGPEPFLAHADPVHWAAITSLGLVLFVITGALTLFGQLLMAQDAHHG